MIHKNMIHKVGCYAAPSDDVDYGSVAGLEHLEN